MENHTAKHFVLQLGSLASLYLSLSFLIVLLFGLINILIPDATDSSWQIENWSEMVRIGIAFTVVFYPTYIILTRIVNKTRRQDPHGAYLSLTKWLIYLSLLVGGGALLVDLVIVIMTFLDGELTQRFLLKAFAVLAVVGSAVHYYLLDAKGYWLKNESKSVLFGIGTTVVVFCALALGLAHIDAPAEVREQKLDETQVQDLQEIEYRIENHLYTNSILPESLSELYEGETAPAAPEDRPDYRYELTESGYQLCATFATDSRRETYPIARPLTAPDSDTPVIINAGNWEHGVGDVCFERIVRPLESAQG